MQNKEFKMIKKLILSTALFTVSVYGSTDELSSTDTIVGMNEKTNYPVWNTSIEKKASGESCKDGNCLSKDGKVYKFITSLRDKVKKQCRKL
jgi:hypothetical protein